MLTQLAVTATANALLGITLLSPVLLNSSVELVALALVSSYFDQHITYYSYTGMKNCSVFCVFSLHLVPGKNITCIYFVYVMQHNHKLF